MKKTSFLLLSIALLAGSSVMAQFNLPPKRGAKAAVDTTVRNKVTNTGTGQQVKQAAPPASKNAVVPDQSAVKSIKRVDTTTVGGFGEIVPKSLRNTTAADRSQTREKKPLEYEHLREDDWLYSENIWREIDAREKMNQSFMYPGKDDNGDQRFFSILLWWLSRPMAATTDLPNH
ncbi:MAG: hypothetical protein NVSMB63_01150 [Sediminibacterium sp.]